LLRLLAPGISGCGGLTRGTHDKQMQQQQPGYPPPQQPMYPQQQMMMQPPQQPQGGGAEEASHTDCVPLFYYINTDLRDHFYRRV
jgi:hypothetical protein